MNWTKAEIKNSKKILELGERKKIVYGDWYEYRGDIWAIALTPMSTVSSEAIPLWTWQDCREWLKKKGCRLDSHYESSLEEKEIQVNYSSTDLNICQFPEFTGEGETDTEAIQKCVIKVLEEA